MIDKSTLWIVIIGLGLGSYLLRFTFIGLVGDRPMPAWLLRHLRYTAVAVLPALVAPQVVWPQATGGEPDIARMAAAVVTLAVGYRTGNVFAGLFAGAATLTVMLSLAG
ncbi:AzlD domain-containing protein [uncultured Roseobacter sp.]|uniref:AzlD domain-containing protein n=1 Tax=uncultured Roseobacter sp. TaxID=114847 RepID=UPI002616E5EC|nr:AzlD domain-containing protein [uncultured Roseobacter sp.]